MQCAGNGRACKRMMNRIGPGRALPVEMTAGIAADIVVDRGVAAAEAAAAGRTREGGPGVDSAHRPATEMTSTSCEVGCAAVDAAEMPATSREMRGTSATEMSDMPAAKMRATKMAATKMRSTTAKMRATAAEVCAPAAEMSAAATEMSAAATVTASTTVASATASWTRIGGG